MVRESHFPPELTDAIVDYLHDDVSALSACALTCTSWLPTVRLHRFSRVSLTCTTISTFLDLLHESSAPFIGDFVQDFALSCSCPVYHGHQEDPEALTVSAHLSVLLGKLSALRTLRLQRVSLPVDQPAPDTLEAIELTRVRVSSQKRLVEWLLPLIRLRSFSIAGLACQDQDDTAQDVEVGTLRSLEDLRLLSYDRLGASNSLIRRVPFSHVHTLSLSILSIYEIMPASQLSRELGPSLTSLELILSPAVQSLIAGSPLLSAYDELLEELRLARCTNLTHLRLLGNIQHDGMRCAVYLAWVLDFVGRLETRSITHISFVVDLGLHTMNPCTWADPALALLSIRNAFPELRRVVFELSNSRAPEEMRGTNVAERTRAAVDLLTGIWARHRIPKLVYEIIQSPELPIFCQMDSDGYPIHARKVVVSCDDSDTPYRWCF
ncbi:hypothetical protein C8Q80DRAFT_1273318 [Daedaleopsis nitida]|nr:hypothetical protein C8Q80DRAFT_1273318 [Daedaleopsis nitida]